MLTCRHKKENKAASDYFCVMRSVLITGANGFIGQYLAAQLLQKGYKVIATGKGESRLTIQHPQLVYETLDFTQKEAVGQLLLKYKPHTVVHAGALSKPDECELNKEAAFLVNVTGTLNLLQAARQSASFFVYLSTDFVFEGSRLDYTEEDALQPVNYYGQTKKLAEEEVKQYPFDWSIVRTILVYGHPRGIRHNILTLVANGLKEGRSLKIVDDQVRTPTYVEDLVKGIVSIIEGEKRGTYNLSGKDVTTPYRMACAAADYLGLDKTKIEKVTAESFNEPARRPRTTGFDLTKARQELGYEPLSFEEGLKKTFEDL